MLALYIIITILLGLVAGYKFGKADDMWQNEVAAPLFFSVLFWPLILVIVIVLGPFFFAYYLGEKAKDKANKQKEEK